jgi:hypothetical protein
LWLLTWLCLQRPIKKRLFAGADVVRPIFARCIAQADLVRPIFARCIAEAELVRLIKRQGLGTKIEET